MLSASVCDRLRDAFSVIGYTVDAVLDALGEEAHRALGRNSTVPAVRALSGRDDPLATLTRLWPLQQTVNRLHLGAALPGLLDPLRAAGVLTVDDDRVRADLDIRPYDADGDQLWVVSDLTPGLDTHVAPMRPDFVLGVSSASSTLAQMTPRRPVDRALDLGTGCGVQALHLTGHAAEVVATDVNPRALQLARATLRLNGLDADLRLGSLYQSVAGERFDLVVTNPPYVIAPPASPGQRLTYREGGYRADGLVEHLLRRTPDVLVEGGTCQILANWAHTRDQAWEDRLQDWIVSTACDAHVVQRETLDAASYVELWLADGGLAGSPGYVARYSEWLDYLGALGITAIGMGWIVLHRTGRRQPEIRIEDWPYAVEQPIATTLQGEPQRVTLSRLADDELLARSWVLADDVVQETVGQPGVADPAHIVLRQQRGFRRAIETDTALAGILGACDGDLPLRAIVEAVADLLDADADELTAGVLPRVRRLIVDGLIGG